MRFRNKKGFVLEGMTAVWIVVSLVVGAIAFFQGPQIVKAIRGGDRNQTKQTLKVTESYPIGHIDDKGKFVKMGDYKKSEDRFNLTAETPPETLWEKFWHLGIMAVVIIIIATLIISYLGLGPLIKSWINKWKAKVATLEIEKAHLHDDAKLIVQSVDAGLQTLKDSKATADAMGKVEVSIALDKARIDFLKAMDTVQDTSTYNLVHELLKND